MRQIGSINLPSELYSLALGLLKNVSDPQAISAEELIRLTKEVMDGDDIIVNGRLFSTECTRTIGDFGLKKVHAYPTLHLSCTLVHNTVMRHTST